MIPADITNDSLFLELKCTNLLGNYMDIATKQNGWKTIRAILREVEFYKEQLEPVLKTNPRLAALAIYEKIDDMVAAVRQDMNGCVTCKRGCSACCHIDLDITEAEGKAIRKFCSKKGIDIDYEYLENQRRAEYRPASQYSACVFLKNNQCSIYEVRPVRCRLYYVASDPALCSAADQVNRVAIYFNYHAELLLSTLATLMEPDKISNVLLKLQHGTTKKD